MPSATVQFILPDTLRQWPWQRQLNPAYLTCKKETTSWTESFRILSPEKQRKFNRCDFGLLGSLMFGLSERNTCRIGCDLMSFGFMFDKFLDAGDESTARLQADIIMDALRNPMHSRPSGEWIVGEMARQFAENALPHADPMVRLRFLDAFQRYTDAVVRRNSDKDHHRVRSIEEYFTLRRETIAYKTVFALYLLDIDLPDEVLNHPHILLLEQAALDMMIISNDLCSYNVEQERGDELHNLVTIAMHEKHFNLHQSLQWIGELHDQILNSFLSTIKMLPHWNNDVTDRNVLRYVDALASAVRGHDCWSFETEKYFGSKGLEIQISRTVDLLPKRHEG